MRRILSKLNSMANNTISIKHFCGFYLNVVQMNGAMVNNICIIRNKFCAFRFGSSHSLAPLQAKTRWPRT